MKSDKFIKGPEYTEPMDYDELAEISSKLRNTHPYKTMWENQLKVNKGLLVSLGILSITSLLLVVGCDIRTKGLTKQIDALQDQVTIGLDMSVNYANRTDALETELASCSSKLQDKKLSPKARVHVKQQPVVAEKIKQVFGNEWVEATELISRESSLNPGAINRSSLACGLGQALPCSKMNCSLSDVDCQLTWVKSYVTGRYGNVSNALLFHDSHNWY